MAQLVVHIEPMKVVVCVEPTNDCGGGKFSGWMATKVVAEYPTEEEAQADAERRNNRLRTRKHKRYEVR